MQCKERLEQYLHEQLVAFQERQHPIAFTAQDVAAQEHIPGKQVAKVVVVFAGSQMVMLVLPAPAKVDFSRLEQILGTKDIRLADEAELSLAFPDCEVGAMPPFGNLYNLPTYVDTSLAEDEAIVFPVGTHTETMRLTYADFQRLVNPTLADFTLSAQSALR